MKEEIYAALKIIKSRKTASLDEIPPKVCKTRKFDNILQLCTAVYKQNTIELYKRKSYILLFPKKGNIRITKNDRGITTIVGNVYSTMLLNHIKIEKILRKKLEWLSK